MHDSEKDNQAKSTGTHAKLNDPNSEYSQAYKEAYDIAFAEAKIRGRRAAAIEIARNSKEMGFTTDVIMKLTGLSESEINGL